MFNLVRMLDARVHINIAKLVYVGIEKENERSKVETQLMFDYKSQSVPQNTSNSIDDVNERGKIVCFRCGQPSH